MTTFSSHIMALVLALALALVLAMAAWLPSSSALGRAAKPQASGLPHCLASAFEAQAKRGYSRILVLPEALPRRQVAAGLGRVKGVCTTQPALLAGALRQTRPAAVIYLRKEPLAASELAALRPTAKVVTYRRDQLAAKALPGYRHQTIAPNSQRLLSGFGRFLSRSSRPAVAIVDRPVPPLSKSMTMVNWQEMPEALEQLCASRSHILALVSPLRIQQLGQWLKGAEPCRSNWYFTSAARNQTTLGPVVAAVQSGKMRAYLFDTIGYYRKAPRLIAAFGLGPASRLQEIPAPQDSAVIRSLYYVFYAVKLTAKPRLASKGRYRAKRQDAKQQLYLFRIGKEGLQLDRRLR